MKSAPAIEAWERPGMDLLADYDAFVAQLACGSQGKYLRRIAVRRFLARWPEPEAWMTRPTAARLVDVERTGAWPFLTWAFVSGALVADLNLFGARANGGHLRPGPPAMATTSPGPWPWPPSSAGRRPGHTRCA